MKVYSSLLRMDLESGLAVTTTSAKLWRWNFIINTPLIIAFITLVMLFEYGFIAAHKSGFNCNDPQLSHKFAGDTVRADVVLSTAILLPLAMMLLTETIMSHQNGRWARVGRALRSTGYIYKHYLYGVMLNVAICEVAKGLMGMPRPVFFDLCKPDTAATCTGSEYVPNFTCTSEYHWWRQQDSYRSFPSGHSSLSLQAGVFMMWYLQRRAVRPTNASTMLVPVAQALCACYTAACSLTRVTDHIHHWWDVLFGLVLGIFTVFYTVYVLLNNFEPKDYTLSRTSQETDIVNKTQQIEK